MSISVYTGVCVFAREYGCAFACVCVCVYAHVSESACECVCFAPVFSDIQIAERDRKKAGDREKESGRKKSVRKSERKVETKSGRGSKSEGDSVRETERA